MAGLAIVDDRFNLPVSDFILQALNERFPDLDIRPGSALYQLLALPVAFTFQPFRDRLNTLRKNQSLRFFQFMLPRELDSLVANFLLERTGSLNANGTVRVFFDTPDNYTVPTTARFRTDDGLSFLPVTATTITRANLLLNFANGLYYLDVPAAAVASGADSAVDAGQITLVEGITGAVSATNLTAFFGGRNEESNAGLAVRTRRSIATRTITSPFATEALLREQFGDSLISVEVIGFGDEEMIRNRARSFVSYDELFVTTYGRKVNVSIDADGVIDTTGSPPATNRFVGAIIDTENAYSNPDAAEINDPYYFFRLPVVRGQETVRLSVNRGDTVEVSKVDQSAGPDPDDGEYTVTDIVYQSPFAGHLAGLSPNQVAKTMMLVLDRPFQNPQSTSIVTTPGSAELVEHEYSITSGVSTGEFHKGGFVDVYVHTVNTFTDEIIVAELFASAAGTDLYDVPVSASPGLNPISQPWYESGKLFQLPVVGFVRVEQIDTQNADLTIKVLEEGRDFIYIPNDPETRYTTQESGFLRFNGSSLLGARVRVVYETNSDIQAIQDFMDASEQRDVTKNVLVKSAKPVIVDADLSFSGSASVSDVEGIVKAYIESRPQGSEITANQLVTVLNSFGVNDITLPMELTARRSRDDGSVDETVSSDRLTAVRLERFVPQDSLSITKTGG